MSKDCGAALQHTDREDELFIFYDMDDAEAWARKYGAFYKCPSFTFTIVDKFDFSEETKDE